MNSLARLYRLEHKKIAFGDHRGIPDDYGHDEYKLARCNDAARGRSLNYPRRTVAALIPKWPGSGGGLWGHGDMSCFEGNGI